MLVRLTLLRFRLIGVPYGFLGIRGYEIRPRWGREAVDRCEFRLRGCRPKDGAAYPGYNGDQYFIECVSRRNDVDFPNGINGYSRRGDYKCRCAPGRCFGSGPSILRVSRKDNGSLLSIPCGGTSGALSYVIPSCVPSSCILEDLSRCSVGPLCRCFYRMFNRGRTDELFRVCHVKASSG